MSKSKCPDCNGELTEPKLFNILVPTQIGVIEKEKTNADTESKAETDTKAETDAGMMKRNTAELANILPIISDS